MGIHLCVFEAEKNGEWDGLRYGYDDEFLDVIWFNEELELEITDVYVCDGEYEERPKDLKLFKDLINKWDIDDSNKERYFHLCDLFEKSKTCGLYVSY